MNRLYVLEPIPTPTGSKADHRMPVRSADIEPFAVQLASALGINIGDAQRVPNPEFNDAARCARTIPPAAKLQAHSAPLGMTFLARATLLPEEYRTDLLVAYHGSWNRDTTTGAKVVRVHVSGGQPGAVEDLVTGWQRADGSRWGRPVDVVVASDGSVMISDDTDGAIYRLSR
jgi:glucose/arabinose dehydrogenase